MTSEQGWTSEVHELSEGFSAIAYDQHGQMIADHLTEERARLIASAPALLEACKKLDAFWLADFEPPRPVGEEQERRLLSKETLDIWREIRAAIAASGV